MQKKFIIFVHIFHIDNMERACRQRLIRQNALNEMAQRAASAGANAVVGVDVDYEVLGADGNMLMVTVSGTAVVVE